MRGHVATAVLHLRRAIPAYTLEGYKLRLIVYAHGDLPMEQRELALSTLRPGERHQVAIEFEEQNPRAVRIDVLRPTGFSTLEAWWKA